jgi:hypothetical protein
MTLLQHEQIPINSLYRSTVLSEVTLLRVRFVELVLSWSALVFSWTFHVTANEGRPEIYLIYLSNWGDIMVAVYFSMITLVGLHHYQQQQQYHKSSSYNPTAATGSSTTLDTSSIHRWTYIWLEITLATTILVTTVFWSVLFKGSSSAWQLFDSIQTHGLNAVLVTIDFGLNQVLVVPSHFLYMLGLAAVYLPINAIYTWNVEPVYLTLRWNDFQSVLFILGTIAISLGAFYLYYGLSLLKIRYLTCTNYLSRSPTSISSLDNDEPV